MEVIQNKVPYLRRDYVFYTSKELHIEVLELPLELWRKIISVYNLIENIWEKKKSPLLTEAYI